MDHSNMQKSARSQFRKTTNPKLVGRIGSSLHSTTQKDSPLKMAHGPGLLTTRNLLDGNQLPGAVIFSFRLWTENEIVMEWIGSVFSLHRRSMNQSKAHIRSTKSTNIALGKCTKAHYEEENNAGKNVAIFGYGKFEGLVSHAGSDWWLRLFYCFRTSLKTPLHPL